MKKRTHIAVMALTFAMILLLGTVGALAAPNSLTRQALGKTAGTAAPAAQPATAQPSTGGGLGGSVTSPGTAVTPSGKEYGSFSGTIKRISTYYDSDGITVVPDKYYVLLENAQGSQASFIVSKDTVRFNGLTLIEGSAFTGYYDATLPMTLQYPPQYTAVAAVIGALEGQFVHVDLFDNDLISKDGTLKLNIAGDTPVALPDGTAFSGDLKGRRLAVLYGASTRSIPAQTTPIRVVVLPVKDVDVPEIENGFDVYVNGDKILLKGYRSKEGVRMIPVKTAAEALGYTVRYNEESRVVSLGNGYTFTVGEDSYAGQYSMTLEASSTLVNGAVYVPLSYFTDVLRVEETGTMSDGSVTINGK